MLSKRDRRSWFEKMVEVESAMMCGDLEPLKKFGINCPLRYGSNALYFAAEEGHPVLMRRLLDAGADPNILHRRKRKETALHVAAATSHKECVCILLEFGANDTIGDEDGQTAEDVASPLTKSLLVVHREREQLRRFVGIDGENAQDAPKQRRKM